MPLSSAQKPENDKHLANTVSCGESSLIRITKLFTTVLACLLLVLSIVVLYVVNSISKRLGIIATLTAFFSLILGLVDRGFDGRYLRGNGCVSFPHEFASGRLTRIDSQQYKLSSRGALAQPHSNMHEKRKILLEGNRFQLPHYLTTKVLKGRKIIFTAESIQDIQEVPSALSRQYHELASIARSKSSLI